MTRRWLDPAFFIDEKMKKATVPERLLATAIIANQDDDGRLKGDPAYLRSIAFLYDDFSLAEVQEMRDHLIKANPNIILYENDGDDYIQLKRYSRYQKPRYYHPSKLPPPPGWPFDKQQPSSNHTVTEQQPSSNQTTVQGLDLDLDLDKGKGEGREQKILHPSPSPADLCTDRNKISSEITEQFRYCFGHVKAKEPRKNIPREPTGKELAQMRDMVTWLIDTGGCPLDFIRQAFREAGSQEGTKSKHSISYVKAILAGWLGRDKSPPP